MYVENVHLTEDGCAVEIIDQTLLPGEKRFLRCRTARECYEAIAALRVRGAPAIGIFAGYALYVLARQNEIKTARIILSGKANSLSDDAIRERTREMYV